MPYIIHLLYRTYNMNRMKEKKSLIMDVKRIVRLYWDRRSQTYGNGIYKSREEPPHFWKTILKDAISAEHNLTILDVGTGTGFLALLFAEMGHNVTGIDISKSMLERSRYNADKLKLTVDFMHCDAENLPFVDETFDIVISRHLLWTMPNPKIAVNEWSRVVRSGGKLMLIDGRWHDPAINMRFRRFLGSIIVFITEKRNPWMFMRYYAKIKDQLPFFNGSVPDDVVYMFNEVGLKNISVNHLEQLSECEKRNASLSYKIANHPSLFLALGEK